MEGGKAEIRGGGGRERKGGGGRGKWVQSRGNLANSCARIRRVASEGGGSIFFLVGPPNGGR